MTIAGQERTKQKESNKLWLAPLNVEGNLRSVQGLLRWEDPSTSSVLPFIRALRGASEHLCKGLTTALHRGLIIGPLHSACLHYQLSVVSIGLIRAQELFCRVLFYVFERYNLHSIYWRAFRAILHYIEALLLRTAAALQYLSPLKVRSLLVGLLNTGLEVFIWHGFDLWLQLCPQLWQF